jgi:murein DD-endopeptidase MepM/ murein hydrolase activator NlpD
VESSTHDGYCYAAHVWLVAGVVTQASVLDYTPIQHNYPSNLLPNPNPCFIRRYFDAVNPDGTLHAALHVLFSDGKGNGVNPPAGSTVTAMEKGDVVASVGTNGPAPEGYPACAQKGGHHAGNYVKIKTQDGYTTTYFHMKPSSNIVVGKTVNAGDTIGVLDTSGCQKAPHLHVQRKDPSGNPVDFTLPCVNPTPQTDYGQMFDYVPNDL